MGSFVFNLDPRVTVLPPDFRCPCAGRAEKVTNPPGACRETTAFDPSKTSRVLLRGTKDAIHWGCVWILPSYPRMAFCFVEEESAATPPSPSLSL